MKTCPLCNSNLIIKGGVIYCSKIFRARYEFFLSKESFIIEDEFYIIDFHERNGFTRFGNFEGTVSFNIKGKFKIINSSVQETYLYYERFKMFS